MRKFLAAVMVAILAACSGGGGTKTPTDCTGSSCVKPAKLVMSLSKAQVSDTGSDTATLTVTALDSGNNILSGAPVSVSADSNAILTPSGTTTDSSGQITASVAIGADKSNRKITLSALSGTVTAVTTLQVTGAQLSASVNPTTIAAGATGSINYFLTDANGNAIANSPIVVNGPNTVTAQTDATGHYPYTYTAPATPGALAISATAAGFTVESSIDVSSGVVPTGDGPVTSATITASPTIVAANTSGDSTNQVEVRVLFLGANNTPLKNVRVRFDLAGDPTNVGGTFASGAGYAYSDSNGFARTQYIPGTRGSAGGQLTLRACYSQNDFTAPVGNAACPTGTGTATTAITVTAGGISIAAFTDLQIVTDTADPLVYKMKYAVQVIDSAGHPKTGVTVSAASKLTKYYKGFFFYSTADSAWELAAGSAGAVLPQECPNEDINGNLVKDIGEDANSSGELDPIQAAAEVYADPDKTNGAVTDALGKAYFVFAWGRSHAFWNAWQLSFSATVDTSEGRSTLAGDHLGVPAAAIKTTGAPPFYISPYGPSYSPTSPVTVDGITVPLCTSNQ